MRELARANIFQRVEQGSWSNVQNFNLKISVALARLYEPSSSSYREYLQFVKLVNCLANTFERSYAAYLL